ncbi:MAG: YdcF family protein [Oscillospiraceae bacterium]|nr:YdcF family protein [Oscillospiraceae bacterium]
MTLTLFEQLVLFVITIFLFYIITKCDYDPAHAEGRTCAELLSVQTLILTCVLPQLKELFQAPIGKILLIPQFFVLLFLVILLYQNLLPKSVHASGDERFVLVPGTSLNGTKPGHLLVGRLDSGAYHLEHNPEAVILVSGGQTENESLPEAHAMRKWLLEEKIEKSRIIVEDRSTTTYENFVFSLPLLKEHGYTEAEPLVIATDRFHYRRCAALAKAAGIPNTRLAAGTAGFKTSVLWAFREVPVQIKIWLQGPDAKPRKKKKK